MWLVIGYGNSLRGDDGAGPYFIDLLRRRLSASGAQFIVSHQLVPELVEEMVQPHIRKVLFVDCRRNQAAPYQLTPLVPQSFDASVMHQMDPSSLLFMVEALYQQTRRGWLLSLTGVEFEHTEELSLLTRSATEDAFYIVRQILTSSANSGSGLTAANCLG